MSSVYAQSQDTTPPQLISFTFTPTSIDTSNSAQTVTFTARVTDDTSGVNAVLCEFFSPSTKSFFANGTRISGTELDGVYQGTFTFPQYSESGTYHLFTCNLFDKAGNGTSVYENDLSSRGFPTKLFVNQRPTAASVKISGKITNAKGRGIFRAIVTLTDTNGDLRLAYTNPFGYYRFNDVIAGDTYVFGVRYKSYTFAPQVLSIVEDYSNLNFTASERR